MIFLERRENVNRLGDQSLTGYDRAVTYEGPEHLSRTAPIRSKTLIAQFNHLCTNISDHVGAITQGKSMINRMVVTYKIDNEDKIWLLWCSSIRLEGTVAPKPIDLSKPVQAEVDLGKETGSKVCTLALPLPCPCLDARGSRLMIVEGVPSTCPLPSPLA